ncbi:hypothetical protein PO909_004619 [Leuciscus waleckii]
MKAAKTAGFLRRFPRLAGAGFDGGGFSQSAAMRRASLKRRKSGWNPFSGITELVSNVLQPQSKSPSEEEPKPKLHQQFEMYKDQVKKIGEEAQKNPEQKGDSPICGICHKTKFADGCGHVCSYCQNKFCARCGGRVSLRSNKIVLLGLVAFY